VRANPTVPVSLAPTALIFGEQPVMAIAVASRANGCTGLVILMALVTTTGPEPAPLSPLKCAIFVAAVRAAVTASFDFRTTVFDFAKLYGAPQTQHKPSR
jgi:hypothetical protein